MNNINVMATDLDEGTVRLTSNVSYLGEKFFQEFKNLSENPDNPDMGYKRTEISFFRVSWLTADRDNRRFLTALVNDAPVAIFNNENTK